MMFEFAISRNQRRRPSETIIICELASGLLHLLMIIVLILNPQLLQGGRVLDFRGISLPWKISEKSEDDLENNRIVTFTNPMEMPSEATLKKIFAELNKKGENPPAVKVPWKGGPDISLSKQAQPAPKIQASKVPEDSNPTHKTATTGQEPASAAKEAEPIKAGSPAGVSRAAQSDAEKKGTINLPAPSPANSDIAKNIPPSAIPDSIKPPDSPNGSESLKVFDNEKQAITREGSGFFDTQGWPLGEYANKIIERIKGKWFIPANLRDSRGRTTVIFYIDKNGRFSGTRIVTGSGNKSLDLAAFNAILQSDPVDPLPPGFPGERIGAKFVFSYNNP